MHRRSRDSRAGAGFGNAVVGLNRRGLQNNSGPKAKSLKIVRVPIPTLNTECVMSNNELLGNQQVAFVKIRNLFLILVLAYKSVLSKNRPKRLYSIEFRRGGSIDALSASKPLP
jgi:hypothetical protein